VVVVVGGWLVEVVVMDWKQWWCLETACGGGAGVGLVAGGLWCELAVVAVSGWSCELASGGWSWRFGSGEVASVACRQSVTS
jgi:hypothetical protein